ncbi:hypothetical protein PHLGIDRAFT_127225 [Phlebiopsis gigantea 11061_1 CR5-6]|uniref:RGS domain-containing protein n=1 Tax=Phlebiopsis gigantea (strain 11061_1 CR5-6) TaxID=745531 RepID=A0A0C3S987_PHLG1|nr:hypothetical protein PHLGIDRAFT_127225 [Phlebiopsis gigantea 11061_1 CR5-6]
MFTQRSATPLEGWRGKADATLSSCHATYDKGPSHCRSAPTRRAHWQVRYGSSVGAAHHQHVPDAASDDVEHTWPATATAAQGEVQRRRGGPSNPRPAHPKAPSTPPTQVQPTHVRLCPAGLRNLPYRLTHPPAIPPELHAHQQSPPPPSADPKGKGKAHWWSLEHWGIRIQPYYEISLEDVLNRKHLPPLGLKDFEEWLLFVEGTAENLYFILWLREYSARYTTWRSSLKRGPSSGSSSHRVAGLSFNLAPPSPHAPQPHRPYASLGLALSTLSLPAAQTQPSSPVARRGSHASAHPPQSSPPPHVDPAEDVLADLPSERHLRAYASPTPLPPPNPSLALFYLRAKETFLAPNAPYELDVGSEVLGGFFVGSSETVRGRRDEDHSPYAPLRNLSVLNVQGLGGKLPPPPDPAVFAELKEIVEQRLKASLARLVVATYHNVGMSRAYCGNAGGVVIGTVTGAPPLIASFTLGASRWYRLLALPGMWLGMTIFISACYGVCMMIYIFGDLRQLRSFELVRPTISQPKLPKDDPPHSPLSVNSPASVHSPYSLHPPSPTVAFSNPFPSTGAPFSVAGGSTAVMSRKMSLPATTLSTGEPSRKMSLPAVLSGFGINRSRERVATAARSEEERLRAAITPLTRPPVLPERRGSVGAPGRPPTLTIIPPEPAYRPGRERMASEVGPLEQVPSDDEDGYASDSSFSSSDDSFDSDSEESEDATTEAPTNTPVSPKHRRHRRRRRRRPLHIEISDRVYEDTSPDGPATAPADFLPGAQSRRGSLALPTANPNPLWPDYDGSEGAHGTAEDATAHFIRPFAYPPRAGVDGVCVVGREGERAGDVERVLLRASPTHDEFDFDGLPPRVPPVAGPAEDADADDEEEEALAVRPASPAPSAATRSDLGSAIDRRGHCWLVRRWWWMLEKLQRRCSPENVVEVLRRKSDESLHDDKGKARAAAPAPPAQVPPPAPTPVEKARRARVREAQKAHAKRRRRVMRAPGLGLRRFYLSVPAFAAPLTEVLNPLVGRAQWEIVVRSALLAAVVSVVVVGGLVGVPE